MTNAVVFLTNHKAMFLFHSLHDVSNVPGLISTYLHALLCRFPLYNPRKLKKWLTSMKLEDWTPSRFSVLCINHFEEQYIDKTGKSVKLREDAVPTVFSSTPGDPQKRNTKVGSSHFIQLSSSIPHNKLFFLPNRLP